VSKPAPGASPAEVVAWIDAYLAELPPEQSATLRHLRETIRRSAPDAVEGISYGLPAFRLRGRPLVGYHATKRHCALFPMDPSVIEVHRSELDGFDLSKGTIRFDAARPLPDALVVAIVAERCRAIESAGAHR
jgi:uncharacterized protein YdhG (YjbR/CyaY superfamily)